MENFDIYENIIKNSKKDSKTKLGNSLKKAKRLSGGTNHIHVLYENKQIDSLNLKSSQKKRKIKIQPKEKGLQIKANFKKKFDTLQNIISPNSKKKKIQEKIEFEDQNIPNSLRRFTIENLSNNPNNFVKKPKKN
jgi:hypothetical protein